MKDVDRIGDFEGENVVQKPNIWEETMASEPTFEEVEEKRGEMESGEDGIQKMMTDMEEAGYTPKKVGEKTVLAVDENGNIRIASDYRELWSEVKREDSEFYGNPKNQGISEMFWDLGNAMMFEDLNGNEDEISDGLWSACKRLNGFSGSTEYGERIESFLSRVEKMGAVGEKVSVIFDALKWDFGDEFEASSVVEEDTELERKQKSYDSVEQLYAEAMVKKNLDTGELEDVARAYESLNGFGDSDEKAEAIRALVEKLERIGRL